jgi:hypothetical protein
MSSTISRAENFCSRFGLRAPILLAPIPFPIHRGGECGRGGIMRGLAYATRRDPLLVTGSPFKQQRRISTTIDYYWISELTQPPSIVQNVGVCQAHPTTSLKNGSKAVRVNDD